MPERNMPQYRFYFLSPVGRISGRQHGEFDNDQDAAIFADGLLRAADLPITSVEGWQQPALAFRLLREGKTR